MYHQIVNMEYRLININGLDRISRPLMEEINATFRKNKQYNSTGRHSDYGFRGVS